MFFKYNDQPEGDSVSDSIPVSRLIFNKILGCHETPSDRTQEKFIKGPIPLWWISRANELPGKAGGVGIALWFLAGVNKSLTFRLTGEVEQIAACNRKAVYNGLVALEGAKLITVYRKNGARPYVTILAPETFL
jgi:hypothetical protein